MIIRTSLRSATLALILVAAGCGGGDPESAPPPQLPAALAEDLAARSGHVAELLAAGDRCGAKATAESLSTAVVEAINAGRVPAPFHEQLGGATAALAARIDCVPVPAPAAKPDESSSDGKSRGKKHGKGHDND